MWLVGMMGSGKTSSGQLAARRLGVGFADTDEEVERATGMTIADLWARDGESRFRLLERGCIAGLAGFEGIVATGGGAVIEEANREVMGAGTVVWLATSPETLARRSPGGRPLLEGDATETLRRLLRSRETLYRDLSDHVIDTQGAGVDEVARRIEAHWKG